MYFTDLYRVNYNYDFSVLFPRDDQDPLYSKNSKMEPGNVTGQSNTLVSPDWEKELMDAGNNSSVEPNFCDPCLC